MIKIPILTHCIQIGGSVSAGVLLYRIRFWAAKGYRQIYKSSREWSEETGLSKKQVDDALSLLRDRGLVTTERKRFKGLTRNCIGVTQKGRKDLSIEPIGSMTLHPEALSIYSENISEDIIPHTSYSECTHAQDTAGKEAKMPIKIPQKKPKAPSHPKPTGSSVAEVLANSKSKPAKTSGMTSVQLEQVWLSNMAEVHDQFVKSLSVADKAGLKHFIAQCPTGSDPGQLLTTVIKNWPDFCVEAQKVGAFKPPILPTVPFLVKYRTAAINTALQIVAPKSQVVQKPLAKKQAVEQTPVQSIAPSGKTAVSDEDKIATMEDILSEVDE